MLINGTLWVQILNFLGFYWIFKRLFLKSAVDVIKSEMSYKNSLENKIYSANKDVRHEKDQQEKILRDCRLKAENNKPDIFDSGINNFKPEYLEITKEDLEKQSAELKSEKEVIIKNLKDLVLKNAHES